MNVVGHQNIGVQLALSFAQGLAEPVQLAAVVFFSKEARFAIVPALHDVQRYAIKVDARTTGHQVMLTHEIYRAWPL